MLQLLYAEEHLVSFPDLLQAPESEMCGMFVHAEVNILEFPHQSLLHSCEMVFVYLLLTAAIDAQQGRLITDMKRREEAKEESKT